MQAVAFFRAGRHLFGGYPAEGCALALTLLSDRVKYADGSLSRWIGGVNDVLWTYVLVAALLGCAVWFTLRTRGVQFRLPVGAMVLFGALATLDLAWSFADVTMALMTQCNLAAIVLLGRQAFLLLADYTAQKRQGIKNPVFTKDRIPELKHKAECW